MSVISVHDLSKRYGHNRFGIRDLTLAVDEGAVFGFLGPNGSGKTTTIRILLGLLRPTHGTAQVFGHDAWRRSHEIKAEIGYIPGDLRLYPWMTARNGLKIFERIRRRPLLGPGMRLCERFELDPHLAVQRMSRGMRQKLGLILALVHYPKVLILDEPTTALDPPMQQSLYAHLRERAAEGVTVFFSSHTLSEVEELCDRVAILRDGRLIAHESLHTLRGRAERHVVVRWNSSGMSANATLPKFLKLADRRAAEWHCTLQGDVNELVMWAAGQDLADLVVTPPDLDELFRRYYDAEEEVG